MDTITLTSFKLCATTPNNTQQHCNNMQQGFPMDATCNIQQCWELLADNVAYIARGFRMKRPCRGVCMEGFDHILCDNFVIILIKGNVDKPIFFCSHQAN